MNRNDFLSMIGSRASFNRSMLGEVYELVDLFPYFQSAHMLLLKGLKDNEDIKFEKQLRSSAIHIADREVLYYLLKGEVSANTSVSPEENKAEAEIKSFNESSPDSQQTVIESAKNSELLISVIETESEKPVDKNQNDSEDISQGYSVLMPAASDNGNTEGGVLYIDENGTDDEDRIFYMDPGFSVAENSDLLELDAEASDNDQISFEINAEESIKGVDDKVVRKQRQSELIDKFIIANPRIEPARDKALQPADDLSKPYTEEKEGFVTETLARIYLNQGYYSRAIDIYEKLSLKFPEKSSYFAAQIEKVKENIKK